MSTIDLSFVPRGKNGLLVPHIDEGASTYGKRDAKDVPRVFIEVKDETGAILFSTWQEGPLSMWRRATLYFDRATHDASGEEIGFSLWD